MKRIVYLLVILSIGCSFLLSSSSSCFAQSDSLVDCFPLSVGNHWLFSFDRGYFQAYPIVGAYVETDRGTSLCKIVGRTVYSDSILWFFEEERSFHRLAIDYPPFPVDTLIDTTIVQHYNFVLIESLINRHELFRQEHPEPIFCISEIDTHIFWNSAIPFISGLPDTEKIYRYYPPFVTPTKFIWIKNYFNSELEMNYKKDSGYVSLSISAHCGDSGTNVTYGLITATLTGAIETYDGLPPIKSSLLQNYPNPFNPQTTIEYELARAGNVRITLSNTLGQETIQIVDKFMEAGRYTATIDGSKLSSGVYFVKLQAGNFVTTRKIMLIR